MDPQVNRPRKLENRKTVGAGKAPANEPWGTAKWTSEKTLKKMGGAKYCWGRSTGQTSERVRGGERKDRGAIGCRLRETRTRGG